VDAGLDAALQRFAAAARSGRVLVALDFDGTLAPFAAEPGRARATAAAAAAVAELARTDGVDLALVSGRGLADLRVVAEPPEHAVLVASHGAEVDGASSQLDDAARGLLERVVEELGAIVASHEGTGLERKAAAAVLHTRRAAPDVAEEATGAALTGPATLPGVHVLRGKEVVELSVVDTDKGRALTALREQMSSGAVLFAGDDVTDEHAFAVLDDDAGDVTIKVGDGDTAARHRVADPDAVARALTRLAVLLH
jgi:trehalose-phosphatase